MRSSWTPGYSLLPTLWTIGSLRQAVRSWEKRSLVVCGCSVFMSMWNLSGDDQNISLTSRDDQSISFTSGDVQNISYTSGDDQNIN
ncbi:hypothetical protein RRG08_039322 [Elysia crispata]|uniref:Uncharacterized protein n=1 Tax=Elysia crispata TaxID=231223 RepID=A0AAE0YR31_9GAST|nr:hypothetical protein RRG08_039322 [Elysia crispata]